ncbi:MAG: isoprenylcysteine carboxylmethyltransferase family protein [Deltaproteobacteria bacterium]|nr:isoprenylcysteine carboxylmethyltransferase family protein [Deltaproteobacteria bacterium]
MIFNYFIFGYLALLIVVSAAFYKHDKNVYSKGKFDKINSPKHFVFIYRYIQLSTFFGIILSKIFPSISIGKFFEPSILVSLVGVFVTTIGMFIFISAKRTLGKHYSPCFDSYVPSAIVESGIYSFIRHPIYSANIVILSGFVLATGSLIIAFNALVLAIYYVDAAIREEAKLAQSFVNYRYYQQRTHMFWPRIFVHFNLKKRIRTHKI